MEYGVCRRILTSMPIEVTSLLANVGACMRMGRCRVAVKNDEG